jgi:hypothetical protein
MPNLITSKHCDDLLPHDNDALSFFFSFQNHPRQSSSPPALTASTTSSPTPHSNSTGVIICGAVGGAFVAVEVIFVVVYVWRRRGVSRGSGAGAESASDRGPVFEWTDISPFQQG